MDGGKGLGKEGAEGEGRWEFVHNIKIQSLCERGFGEAEEMNELRKILLQALEVSDANPDSLRKIFVILDMFLHKKIGLGVVCSPHKESMWHEQSNPFPMRGKSK
jgi:hypothetical protein